MLPRAGALVVRVGDRVTASGRFVHRDGGDWLDLSQITDLLFHAPDWVTPRRGVQLIGADPAAVRGRDDPDPTVEPGCATVTGVWQDGTITVDTQTATARTPPRSDTLFRLPPPPGGWDATEQSRQVTGLDELRASGAIAVDRWRRVENEALVLQVAACDVQLVRDRLGPQLPRRLTVVRSRYSAEQVHSVAAAVHAHWHDWLLDSCTLAGLDPDGQPYARAHLMYVTADLGALAATLPTGLLRLYPAMRPA